MSVRAAIVAVIALPVLGIAASLQNPERAIVESQLQSIDALISDRKALVADLDRYKAELASLTGKLEIAERKLHPDLDALPPEGVALERKHLKPNGSTKKHMFEMSGASADSIGPLLASLEKSGHLFLLRSLELSPSGWKAELFAFEIVYDEPAPPPPQLPPEQWYSIMNRGPRSDFARKARELAALDAQLGDVERYAAGQRRLKLLTEIIDHLRKQALPLLRVSAPLFVGPESIFTSGRLASTSFGADAHGELRRPMDAKQASPRIDTDVYELETWNVEGTSVELSLRRTGEYAK